MSGVPDRGRIFPAEAPDATRAAFDRFAAAAAADRRIVAAFLGGSFASGSWDEHSDLDLYVIVDDADYAAVFAGRVKLLEAIGEVVLAEDFDGFGFDLVVFMLADGVEGELGFGRRSGFAHLHGGPYRVVVDRDDVLAEAAFPLQRPSAEARRRSIRRSVAWSWHLLSLVATALARGRAWTACGYLERARREALDVVWWLDAHASWPGGFEKLEDFPGTGRAAPIADTLVGLDPEAQRVAAAALAEFVSRHGRIACAAVDVEYPAALERTVARKLERIGAV